MKYSIWWRKKIETVQHVSINSVSIFVERIYEICPVGRGGGLSLNLLLNATYFVINSPTSQCLLPSLCTLV